MSEPQLLLGAFMRRRRKELGMSQGKLGLRLGLSRPSIANVEADRHSVTLDSFLVICAALDSDPIDVFAETIGRAWVKNHPDKYRLRFRRERQRNVYLSDKLRQMRAKALSVDVEWLLDLDATVPAEQP